MSSNVFRTAAEEAFLEQTPWANPQHPIHHQQSHHHYSQQHRPQGQTFDVSHASFATPAAQKQVVDVNAPNGSASTIAENISAANSSANNTPYGVEQETRYQALGPSRNLGSLGYDADRKPGLRSESSSPLDVRKPQAHFSHGIGRSPDPPSPRTSIFSPPPARQNLFHHPLPSKTDGCLPTSPAQVG